MEKRLPLALLLSLLFAWLYVQMTAPPPQEGGPPADGGAFGADETGAGGALPMGSVPTLPPGGMPPRAGLPAGVVAADAGPSTTVPIPFGERFHAEFQTRGAVLSLLELDQYGLDAEHATGLPLLGVVNDTLGSFQLTSFDGRFGLDRAEWQHASGKTADGRPAEIFTHDNGQGLLFTKSVVATGQDYTFDLLFSVANTGGAAGNTLTLLLRGPQGVADSDYSSFASMPPSAVALVGDGTETELLNWPGDDIDADDSRQFAGGNDRLLAAGAMTNYFASLLVPHPGTSVNAVYAQSVLDLMKVKATVAAGQPANEMERRQLEASAMDGERRNASVQLLLARTWPQPGQPWEFGFTVYTGPKDRVLAGTPGLEFLTPLIESAYGSMAWINRSLLAIMEFFEGLSGNWGVAIILLTVLVKLMLFPLSRMQQSSMAKYGAVMQGLKPELDAMKEKHKNNKQKFNQENMRLMKEHGVRPPLGGCLLMIPQMFIWISLFQVLRSSIELRQAPFAFWITDLSRPDELPLGMLGFETFNLLPILMAGAMLLQMKSTPQTAADPSQEQMQKVMAFIMPVMMLLFLYSYPSGLALYIFVSSLLGIFEYRVIRKYWPPPTAASLAAATGGGSVKTVPATVSKGGKSGKGGGKRR